MTELSWTLPMKGMNEVAFREACEAVAARYVGVVVTVEREESDCLTAFFAVPEDPGGPKATLEVSIYDLGRDGRVLGVEPESSDNANRWDDACQLGDEVADLLDGEPLD